MNMQGKVAVVTGGARGIGKAIYDAFKENGAYVYTIDLLANDDFVGDIADKLVLEQFANYVLQRHPHIDYLINNAMLSHGGIHACSYEQFNHVLQIGVTAPFYLAKLFAAHFNTDAAIVNISSSRYAASQPDTESYTAAKGGITALTHALAATLAGSVRVNAIAPGWIDTTGSTFSPADQQQHTVGRVGVPEDIVNAVMFLCSTRSSFINGQVLTVDGGMSKQMIYHQDYGWTYDPAPK